MAYKTVESKIFFESGEYIIKTATPAERATLHEMFVEIVYNKLSHADKVLRDADSVPRLTIVALDKENRVMGGIERAYSTRLSLAIGAGLAVLPEFREQGIGKKLVEVCDEELRERGIRKVSTDPLNKEAWEFLRRCGYEYDTEDPHVPMELKGVGIDKEQYYEGYPMKKYL